MKQLSIKVLRSLVLGEKISRCNLSLELFSLGAVFVWKICPTSNYVGEKSYEKQFPAEAVSRGYCQGALSLG